MCELTQTQATVPKVHQTAFQFYIRLSTLPGCGSTPRPRPGKEKKGNAQSRCKHLVPHCSIRARLQPPSPGGSQSKGPRLSSPDRPPWGEVSGEGGRAGSGPVLGCRLPARHTVPSAPAAFSWVALREDSCPASTPHHSSDTTRLPDLPPILKPATAAFAYSASWSLQLQSPAQRTICPNVHPLVLMSHQTWALSGQGLRVDVGWRISGGRRLHKQAFTGSALVKTQSPHGRSSRGLTPHPARFPVGNTGKPGLHLGSLRRHAVKLTLLLGQP